MRRIFIAVEETAFAAIQRRAIRARRDVRRQVALELERIEHVREALAVLVDRDPPLDRLDALCAYCFQTRSRTPDEHGADCPWAAARRIWEEPSRGNPD